MFKEDVIKQNWLEVWPKIAIDLLLEKEYSKEFVKYVSEHIDLIFTEMEKAKQILDSLQETKAMFKQFLSVSDMFFSPEFGKKVNENISLGMDFCEGIDTPLQIVCEVSYNKEQIEFYIQEGSSEINYY